MYVLKITIKKAKTLLKVYSENSSDEGIEFKGGIVQILNAVISKTYFQIKYILIPRFENVFLIVFISVCKTFSKKSKARSNVHF